MKARASGLVIFPLLLMASLAHAEPAREGYSAADLYNTANSYARAGKPAMAVLNYKRAALLAPGDPDIEANLRFVRQSARLPVDGSNWFERSFGSVDPVLGSWAALAALTLLGAGVLLGRPQAKFRFARRAAMFIGVIVLLAMAANAIMVWPKLKEAVILTAATPMRATPVPMGDALAELPEAETVRIMAMHEGFVLVRTRAGKTGWVADANIAAVVPRTTGDALP
jgi:hypothetical protein